MLLLLFPNSHSWLDQESYDDGGIYPSLHCTAHEDKVPGPCRGGRIADAVQLFYIMMCLPLILFC